jgi:GTPase SAR1 family protein
MLNRFVTPEITPVNYLKIMLLGDYHSAKHEILECLAGETISPRVVILFNCHKSRVAHHSQTPAINLMLFDTSDQDRFRGLLAKNLNMCEIALICVNSRDEVGEYLNMLSSSTNPGIPFLFVSKENKANDLPLNSIAFKPAENAETFFAKIVDKIYESGQELTLPGSQDRLNTNKIQ